MTFLENYVINKHLNVPDKQTAKTSAFRDSTFVNGQLIMSI